MPNAPHLLSWKLTWLSDLFFTLLPLLIEKFFLCTVAFISPLFVLLFFKSRLIDSPSWCIITPLFLFVCLFLREMFACIKATWGENQSPLSIWLLPHVQIDTSNRPQARGSDQKNTKFFNALHNLYKCLIIMH